MALDQRDDMTSNRSGLDLSPSDIPAEASQMAESVLGLIHPGIIRSTWTQDALLFGYNSMGVARYYRIPYSEIPLNLGETARVQGRSPWVQTALRQLQGHFELIESQLHRPATQSEAEGFALAAQNYNETRRRGSLLTFFVASAFAYRSRSDFRFPGYTPKDQTRFNFFPMKSLPLLKASAARICWHLAARLPAYTIASTLLLAPFVSAYSSITSQLLVRQDSRTSGAYKEAAAKIAQDHQDRRSSTQNRAEESKRNLQRRHPQQTSNPDARDDSQVEPRYSDMDENQRVFQASEQTPHTSSRDEPDLPSRDQPQGYLFQPSSPTSTRGIGQAESVYGSSEPGFYDDNSPSGGRGLESTGSDQQSGSAWDRVRSGSVGSGQLSPWGSDQGSKPRKYETKRQRQSYGAHSDNGRDENETTADSFSFSKSGVERELAKEQAQKEFDRMVEAERKGQDGS